MASSVDTCKSEDHILVIFYILFDNNLQIKDVRYNGVCPKAENGDSIINKYLLYLCGKLKHKSYDKKSHLG